MATRLPSTILDWVDTRMAVITTESPDFGFAKATDRVSVEKTVDSAIEGLYETEFLGFADDGPQYGDGSRIHNGSFRIKLGYLRPHGDLNGGDGGTVMRNAADDCQRVRDVIACTDGYDGDNTGIRRVIPHQARPVAAKKNSEVWACDFDVQWQSDEVTT